jgi:folate-binding protein YgfZ
MHCSFACPAMPHAVLPEVNCILIEGADARRFAQAQFAGDVESLAQGEWQWNAWLDAQGRVRALMHLARLGEDHLLAILRGGDVEKTRASLARYVFRARASVAVRTFSGHAGGALPMGRVDGGTEDMISIGYGDRSLQLKGRGNASPDEDAANAWRLADIRAGWPVLPADDARFLPPALGLEHLGAVSLDKGCYPGQEIVARLHWRGGNKSNLCHVRGPSVLDSDANLESMQGPVAVLGCAVADGRVEALVVAPKADTFTINILGNEYEILSRYDA